MEASTTGEMQVTLATRPELFRILAVLGDRLPKYCEVNILFANFLF